MKNKEGFFLERKCSYYAVFEYDVDGINISFPDIPFCLSCAFDEEEAVKMATEVLELGLHGMSLEEIPTTALGEAVQVNEKQQKVEITVFMEEKLGKLFSENVVEIG